jgi:hypothetical protein
MAGKELKGESFVSAEEQLFRAKTFPPRTVCGCGRFLHIEELIVLPNQRDYQFLCGYRRFPDIEEFVVPIPL